jgi:hypothetical protein
MADKKIFTLSDGTEVNFDFSKVTRTEYRSIFDPKQPSEDGDAVISKITGLTDLGKLTQQDWARLVQEIVTRANRPDPT